MKYKSPTTPGLEIEFNHYLIELICLNMNHKLGPRFWSNSGVYDWGSKYRREIKGVNNLLQNFEFPDDQLLRGAIIEVIQQHRIKSLLAKKTIARAIKLIHKKIFATKQKIMANQPVQTEAANNIQFTNTESKTGLGKLRDLE